MKKIQKILLVILCGVLFVPLSAQEGDSYAPKAGDIQTNLLLGNGMFYNTSAYNSLFIQRNAAEVGTGLTTNLPAYITLSDPNNNSIVNMIGLEFKYFVMDNIAVSFSGAGYINSTPWREAKDAITTTIDTGVNPFTGDEYSSSSVTVIPKYVNIDAQLRSRMVLNFGGQYYFKTGSERIRPYAGVMFSFQYASIQAESTYAGALATNNNNQNPLINELTDAGMRTGQIIGWAPAFNAGIEYSVLPGLTVGFEFKPVSMYYSNIRLFAQPGLEALAANNYDWTFFAQPQFKIGFRFSEFSLF